MTDERYNFLQNNPEARLTDEEFAESWRFCCEWDGLLIFKDDKEATVCTCLKNALTPSGR